MTCIIVRLRWTKSNAHAVTGQKLVRSTSAYHWPLLYELDFRLIIDDMATTYSQQLALLLPCSVFLDGGCYKSADQIVTKLNRLQSGPIRHS